MSRDTYDFVYKRTSTHQWQIAQSSAGGKFEKAKQRNINKIVIIAVISLRLQSNSPGSRPRTRTLHPGAQAGPAKETESSIYHETKCRASAATPVPTTSTSVNNICQTQARDTVFGIPLAPTKYREEPERVNIKTDIVTSPYNSQKACHRRYFYAPSKPRNPEAIQTNFALQEWPDTPYQPQPPGRSKMKWKRTADPSLQE
ncbi:unnamed protein product [Mytilus coruscus]|uniref:Uncharacterized protein n=1 Tax=Mytilus coruscus TaxID=42192 RepID=A0A6J8BG36_MYTCO|nr:unnamed protein product [Mytilus coruscus]